MARDEAAIEKEIRSKGLNAPRLTPAMIDDVIVQADYHVLPIFQIPCPAVSRRRRVFAFQDAGTQ